ncbi:hypothetical protein GN956_G5115 [Arapaima gigas]
MRSRCDARLQGRAGDSEPPLERPRALMALLTCSGDKADLSIPPRNVARLVVEAEQDGRNGGNSSNGR